MDQTALGMSLDRPAALCIHTKGIALPQLIFLIHQPHSYLCGWCTHLVVHQPHDELGGAVLLPEWALVVDHHLRGRLLSGVTAVVVDILRWCAGVTSVMVDHHLGRRLWPGVTSFAADHHVRRLWTGVTSVVAGHHLTGDGGGSAGVGFAREG